VVSLLGLGSAAVSGWLDRLKTPLLILSIALVCVSLFIAHVRRPSRRNKIVAWASAAVTGSILLVSRL
jgi:hypothetical protein